MADFLNKFVYLEVFDQNRARPFRHKCAKVTSFSETHIGIFDTFDGKPYFYRLADVIKIELSTKDPAEYKEKKVEERMRK